MKIGGNRFLITGGAGLMGSHITDQLLAKGASEIILLDNFVRGSMHNIEDALKDKRVRLVKGDIRDLDLLMDLASDVDGMFHMAALRITACADNPREAMEVMLTGTHNVIQTAVEKKVGKLVYASSASVYGLADVFPTNEKHHAFNNRTLYGSAKIAGEGMARSFAEMYGLQYIALRYFNVYGPRMDIHGKYTEVLVRWLDRVGAGQPPIIFGDGLRPWTSFILMTLRMPISLRWNPMSRTKFSMSQAGRRPVFWNFFKQCSRSPGQPLSRSFYPHVP